MMGVGGVGTEPGGVSSTPLYDTLMYGLKFVTCVCNVYLVMHNSQKMQLKRKGRKAFGVVLDEATQQTGTFIPLGTV